MEDKINTADKARIKQIMKTDDWESIIKFFGIKIESWRAEKVTGTSEFEELRMLHTNQGKVDGLTEFMDQLERQAFE